MPSAIEKLAKLLVSEAKLSGGRKDANGVLIDLNPNSDITVISCSGVVPDRVIYAMENTSHQIPVNRVFICDRRSLWYYKGIEGLTGSFDETVELVGSIFNYIGNRNSCSIGTSGGGYMALALASKLGLDRALALSPQSNIGRVWTQENGENRWPDNFSQIYDHIGPRDPYDIHSLIRERNASPDGVRSEFHVIYPNDDAQDCRHVLRLSDEAHVSLYGLANSEHNTSAELSKRGSLGTVLETFIQHQSGDLKAKISAIL